MHYFALLLGPESTEAPDAATQAEIMTAYQNFHIKAGPAIRAGDALTPSATGVRISGGPDHPVVTDGPFAEGAEVAGGYYVFEAENLDEALSLARDIPACQVGAVEVWPIIEEDRSEFAAGPLTGNTWLALLLEPAEHSLHRVRQSGTSASSLTSSSARPPGTPWWVVHRCIRRRRRRPCGCATGRSP